MHTTRLVGDVIAGLENPPRLWMNASTATIYRIVLDRPMDEFTGEFGGYESIEGLFGNARPAPETWNFSLQVARDWDNAVAETPTPQTRKIPFASPSSSVPRPAQFFLSCRDWYELALAERRATAASSSPGSMRPTSHGPLNSSLITKRSMDRPILLLPSKYVMVEADC